MEMTRPSSLFIQVIPTILVDAQRKCCRGKMSNRRTDRSFKLFLNFSFLVTTPSSAVMKRSSSSYSNQDASPSKKGKRELEEQDTEGVLSRPELSFELEEEDTEGVLLHPKLSFVYQDAVDHLIAVDDRWSSLMSSYKCRIFEGEQTGEMILLSQYRP